MAPDPNPAIILLAILVPIGIVGVILGTVSILVYQRMVLRSREMATELVVQMLNRKLSVDEIERVLLAWSQDPDLAKSMARCRKQLATGMI
jgi:hypothetical protein